MAHAVARTGRARAASDSPLALRRGVVSTVHSNLDLQLTAPNALIEAPLLESVADKLAVCGLEAAPSELEGQSVRSGIKLGDILGR